MFPNANFRKCTPAKISLIGLRPRNLPTQNQLKSIFLVFLYLRSWPLKIGSNNLSDLCVQWAAEQESDIFWSGVISQAENMAKELESLSDTDCAQKLIARTKETHDRLLTRLVRICDSKSSDAIIKEG